MAFNWHTLSLQILSNALTSSGLSDYVREVHRQGYPGCIFHLSLLECSPTLERSLRLVSLMTTHMALEVLGLKGAYRAGYAVLGATAIWLRRFLCRSYLG
jgi:hypothetical protein